MTTTPAAPMTTCPNWCTLDPGHGWDSEDLDNGEISRGHAGPTFGKHVFVSAIEFKGFPEDLVHVANVGEIDGIDLDYVDLRDLAAAAIEAAAWLRDVAGFDA